MLVFSSLACREKQQSKFLKQPSSEHPKKLLSEHYDENNTDVKNIAGMALVFQFFF